MDADTLTTSRLRLVPATVALVDSERENYELLGAAIGPPTRLAA